LACGRWRILAEAREETGLPLVTELMDPRHVEAVIGTADVVEIGARNMQNSFLLSEVGQGDKPVLLKRGPSASVEELLMAAEYILKEGNPRVILCERGIRTFERSTRYTLDILAIPVLKRETHLPVIVYPSHAAGRRELVPALARAAGGGRRRRAPRRSASGAGEGAVRRAAAHRDVGLRFLRPGHNRPRLTGGKGRRLAMSGSNSTDMTTVEREIHGFIVSELVSGDGGHAITADEDLIKRGIVDSLGVAQLVEFCESRYGIRVADADLVPENFRTLRGMADYVDRKRADKSSSGRLRLRSRGR
jgi:acyl carrier protein